MPGNYFEAQDSFLSFSFSGRSRGARALFGAFAAAGLLVYGVYLYRHTSVGVGGSDPAGYANTARDIAAGRIVLPIPALGALGFDPRRAPVFTPLAHEPGPRPATMVPFYPPGYPLHLAAAAALGGWEKAPFLVNPIAAVLCLVLMYRLGRELGLSWPYALVGAAILGAWNLTLYAAVEPLSDLTAALWALAAMVAALGARRRTGWAAAAGAAFGMAVLVRPTNALLLVPLALALPWRPGALALFAAAGSPFAGFYGAWNREAFGSPFRTGYSHLFAQEFVLSNFGPRLERYGAGIVQGLSVLVPLGGLACAADRRVPRRDRAMLVSWFAAIFVFYCFWGPSDSWTYVRYLQPATPPLVVGFLLSLRDLTGLLPRTRWRHALMALALVVVFVFERREVRRRRPFSSADPEMVYPEACRAIAERAGRGPALVVSMDFSAALRFYTGLEPVRWDFLEPGEFATLRARAAERGWRLFAVLKPYEVSRAAERVPGPWVFLGNVRDAGLWELPPGP